MPRAKLEKIGKILDSLRGFSPLSATAPQSGAPLPSLAEKDRTMAEHPMESTREAFSRIAARQALSRATREALKACEEARAKVCRALAAYNLIRLDGRAATDPALSILGALDAHALRGE